MNIDTEVKDTEVKVYGMYIDGRWVDGESTLPVVNPATEATIAQVPIASARQIDEALRSASRAQKGWARLTGVERGNFLRRWADLVDRERERLARIISEEEGKPLSEALGEVDFGNSWFRYYAEFDRRIEGEILPSDRPDEQIWITRAPAGVVLGIIPWNYPSAVAIRKIAPALICGNAIVLKPHEDTPLSALELAKLAEEAGLPAGVLNVVTGPGETVGEALVKSPIPRVISFTGSVATGKRIMRNAADNVALVSLELGGKAPFVVMDDSDLASAVKVAIASRFVNCGQVCICNERTYVHRGVAKEFIRAFVEEVDKLTLGNPLLAENMIGPKVNRAELEKVERYVDQARQGGAKVLTGGKRPSKDRFQKGHWYEPTVIVNVKQDMPIMQEEVFGPVVPIMEFSDFDEAIALANDSRYGLAAYLFTKDMDRVMRAVRDLECGELYINRGPGESIHGYHTGWKQSGIGGDDGKHGLDHYLQRKTVYVRYQG
jgi:lactaldehyde dehydrogenase/glycolaldehyde dehydrogenase